MHIGNIAILKGVLKMTKKEKMRLIKQAEKVAAEPKLNPEYKRGKLSHSEIYRGVKREKYINEWAD